MTESRHPTPAPIADELLSAYIDGQVTGGERQRVQQALATDREVQERYETLQITVDLMQKTPPVRVPRAFVLSEAQVLAAGGKVKGVKQPSFFERIFPRLMPLATAAVALLLVVLVSIDLLPGFDRGSGASQPAMQLMESAAAPAQEQVADMEMAVEEPVEMAMEAEATVWTEKEFAGEEMATQEDTMANSREANEALSPRAAAKMEPSAENAVPQSSSDIAEAPLAAAPPPAPEAEMADDEADSELQASGGSAESFAAESPPAPSTQAEGKPAWLRPLELTLALLFICLLAVTLLIRKRTRADAS